MEIIKRYDTDWAKAKARKIVKDTIADTLLVSERPENLRVLCLPGVDATELTQVYLPLGIPKTNIVGVEKDEDIANLLKSKHLGIEIVRSSVEDYIASQKTIDFDVISLDYTGPLSNQQLETLGEIIRKQTRNQFVLHTANLLKRDGLSAPFYQLGYSQTPYVRTSEIQENSEDELRNMLIDRAAKWIDFSRKKECNESLSKEKKLGYHSIIEMACLSLNVEDANKLLKFALGRYYGLVLSSFEENYGVSINRVSPFDTAIHRDSPPAQFLLQAAIRAGLISIASQIGLEDKPHQLALVQALEEACRSERHFVNLGSTTYSYISETGAPMIGDVSFLKYPEDFRRAAIRIGRILGLPSGNFRKPSWNPQWFYESLEGFVDKLAELYSRERLDKLKAEDKVHFLGSSAKPLLTKAKAIDEFKNGASVSEIREKYRGCNGKPLAQWKAHVTMRTYDKGLSDEPETENTEKLSREDALLLIDAGIPLEEIVKAFPNETIGRLRAFKAHKTMGTYDQ